MKKSIITCQKIPNSVIRLWKAMVILFLGIDNLGIKKFYFVALQK